MSPRIPFRKAWIPIVIAHGLVLCPAMTHAQMLEPGATSAVAPPEPAQGGDFIDPTVTPPGTVPPPTPKRATKNIPPPWAEASGAIAIEMHPLSEPPSFSEGSGGLPVGAGASSGPSDGIGTMLSTGTVIYTPAPDLSAYNPTGPTALFQRCFRSDRAETGYGSPGLAPGWVHNFDVTIASSVAADGKPSLTLVYPSGATEPLTPLLDPAGVPTGRIKATPGAPYIAEGRPSAQPGAWDSLNITWKSRVNWTFTPWKGHPGQYELHNLGGLTLYYDDAHRIWIVGDDAAKVSLLKFAYDDHGYLNTVTESKGRWIAYRFGAIAPGSQLVSLFSTSIVRTKEAPSSIERFIYTYQDITHQPYLTRISVPNPGGPGRTEAKISYGADAPHMTDANGNHF